MRLKEYIITKLITTLIQTTNQEVSVTEINSFRNESLQRFQACMKQMVGYWRRCNGASYTASGMSRDAPDLLPCRGQTMLVDSTQFLQDSGLKNIPQ